MTDDLSNPKLLPMTRVDPFDPPTDLRTLRETEPISRLRYPDGHIGWLVTSHRLAREVLADQRFSARQDLRHLPVNKLASGSRRSAAPGMFDRMDPPEHTHYRRLLTGLFSKRRIGRLEPRIQQVAEMQLNAMEHAGPPVDLVQKFAVPLPLLVICELLGVPYADRTRFRDYSTTILNLDSTAEQAMSAFVAMRKYLQELISIKRIEASDDLLSGLIETSDLTNQELGNISLVLLIAGHETTANMLALGTFALLRHPDQLARLRSEPTLMEDAVDELLRYLSIIHIGPIRAALEDVELEGKLIKAGDCITVSIPAANRDPDCFQNPDSLDINRSAIGHLTFGHGVHQCLGRELVSRN
jgi:cytochrome P450